MPSTSKSSEDFVNVTISGNEITESDIQTEKLTSKSRDPLEALSKSILAASNLGTIHILRKLLRVLLKEAGSS